MEYYLVSGVVELEMMVGEDPLGFLGQTGRVYVDERLVFAESEEAARREVLEEVVSEKRAVDGEWVRCRVEMEPADRAMHRLGAARLPGM